MKNSCPRLWSDHCVQGFCLLFWTTPGISAQQNCSCTALISQTMKKNNQDMLGIAWEGRTNSYTMFVYELLYMDTPMLVDQQKI